MGSPPSPRALEGRVPAMASKSFAAGYLLIDTASCSFFPALAHRIPAELAGAGYSSSGAMRPRRYHSKVSGVFTASGYRAIKATPRPK